MTKLNNYTRPPENMPAIEFCGFMDTDASRRDFEENFEVLQHSGYRTTSVLYYIDYGNVKGADEVKFTVKGKKADKVNYLAKELNFTKKEIRSWDIETINNEILSYFNVNLIDYALERMDEAPEGLQFVPNKNLIVVSSQGYSQGDYSVIVYCPDDLEKAWGNYPVQSDMQKTFNHLLWDCPVYACFTIDGEEYNYWDFPDADTYQFKREEFLQWVSAESGASFEALDEVCPNELTYN